jgi:hypothetical protein
MERALRCRGKCDVLPSEAASVASLAAAVDGDGGAVDVAGGI